MDLELFDIVGSDVVIHKNIWAIPVFNEFWNSRKNAGEAEAVMKYVIFNNHPKSLYVTAYTTEARKTILRNEFLSRVKIDDSELKKLEDEFIELTDTLKLKTLRKLRSVISRLIEELDSEELDIEKALDLGAKAEKAISAIIKLEESIAQELKSGSKIKGGRKVGILEQRRGL